MASDATPTTSYTRHEYHQTQLIMLLAGLGLGAIFGWFLGRVTH